jgi:bifunctional non-homologous end joining protein LigD
MNSFCKTTGGKGLHVVVPLAVAKTKSGSEIDWRTAKLFAQTLCAQMAGDSPQLYLINMSKAQRRGRIFLDYLRNDRLATAVAPLSPRARPGATVSMPLGWQQVRTGLDPARFTIDTAFTLLNKTSPWQDYTRSDSSLMSAMKALLKQHQSAA